MLEKLFIRNYKNLKDKKVIKDYGVLASLVGIILNILLFSFKFLFGFLTGMFSLTVDAFNNLGDVCSSIITLIGFKISGKPADRNHPFGYKRMDYISSLFVSFFILIMGVELLRGSIVKIFTPNELKINLVSFIFILISIFCKVFLSLFYRSISFKIHSLALKTSSKDSLMDCFSTSIILISFIIYYFFRFNIDGYIGFLLSFFIIFNGIHSIKESISPLLGVAPNEEILTKIKDVLDMEEILGYHDIIFHSYGEGKVFVSLHIELPEDLDILTAHNIVDNIERKIGILVNCEVLTHVDPVQNDINTLKIKDNIFSLLVNSFNMENIKIHDFRISYEENLIYFDLEVPFLMKKDDLVLRDEIYDILKDKYLQYEFIVKIDRF